MREDLSDLRMKAIDLYGHPSDVGTQLVLACCALTDVEFHLKWVIEFRKVAEERMEKRVRSVDELRSDMARITCELSFYEERLKGIDSSSRQEVRWVKSAVFFVEEACDKLTWLLESVKMEAKNE